ncbi:hypothetical protein EG68_00131 [Paragonimus skrjabini miyazakii]|uniref:Uncharacterized protein n=1 Tax=Paragonimus skrjabini miyazakii TaxID=59628 RepID=A0A8S9Z572_9TREM|nr:hypothetical protein EG68_00131 [Paragonimus skrjabini miyazakii]
MNDCSTNEQPWVMPRPQLINPLAHSAPKRSMCTEIEQANLLQQTIDENSRLREKLEQIQLAHDNQLEQYDQCISQLKSDLNRTQLRMTTLQSAMNQELHVKLAEDTHLMTDDRIDTLQKKTGRLDTELSKIEKLKAEKDALDQQLQAYATEREKLISDNAYLDNLVESLKNQLDRTRACSPTVKCPMTSSDPGQSVKCACCLRLLAELRDYRNLYGKLVYQGTKCNDDTSTTNSLGEDKGFDCKSTLPEVHCVLPGHTKTQKLECNNSACNKQSLQTKLKISSGVLLRKTGDSFGSTPGKDSSCDSSAFLHHSEPETERNRAAGVNHTANSCGTPRTGFDEMQDNQWDCPEETIDTSWEDSVNESSGPQLKVRKGITCRESQLSKALKRKSLLCRSLYTQNTMLVSKLAAMQSRLRVAQRAARLWRARSAVGGDKKNSLKINTKMAPSTKTIAHHTPCGVMNHRLVALMKQNALLQNKLEHTRLDWEHKYKHLEVLLQAKDVQRQPVFSRLPFTVKKRKSLIKQTATYLHSGRFGTSSSTRAKQCKRRELSDSSSSPEIQCHSHVGNIISLSGKANERDQPCEEPTASTGACLPSPLVLVKQRNNCLVQQLRVARAAKIGLKHQTFELAVQLKKALNALHQSRHRQERSERIIQHLIGYMHSLDSILGQFEEESTTYPNETNSTQSAQASPVVNCELIHAKVEAACSMRNPFEFSHTLAVRLHNVLRTKQQLWAELRKRMRASAQEEQRRRALIEELRDNLCQSREKQKQIKTELDKKIELVEVARVTEDRLRSEIESQRTRLKTLQKEKYRLVHELDSCQEAHDSIRSQLAELQGRLITLGLTARTDDSHSANDCRLAADGQPLEKQRFQAGSLNQFASYVTENLSKLALQVLQEFEQTVLKPNFRQTLIHSTTRKPESASVSDQFETVSSESLDHARCTAANILGLSLSQLDKLTHFERTYSQRNRPRFELKTNYEWLETIRRFECKIQHWPTICSRFLRCKAKSYDLQPEDFNQIFDQFETVYYRIIPSHLRMSSIF